ncbi:MAG: heliorhodopsin HeR [Candidatus Thorarchaeota archaeon]
MEGIREQSNITYPKLRRFNAIMGSFHLIQAIFMLIAGFVIPGVKDAKLDVTTDYLYFDLGDLKLKPDFVINEGIIPIAILAASFLFLSAFAHFLTILPGVNDFYNKKLEQGINYFRWFEYALSSSIMIMLISMLFGIYNIAAIIAIVGLNATMNLMGLMMEKHNQTTTKTDWTAFIIGTFSGIIPWILILIYLFGNGSISEIPWFVWAIFGGYFFFFWTFPINMILQYAKVGKWKDYLFGERGYIILSLVSKSLLAWLVFGGTFQP